MFRVVVGILLLLSGISSLAQLFFVSMQAWMVGYAAASMAAGLFLLRPKRNASTRHEIKVAMQTSAPTFKHPAQANDKSWDSLNAETMEHAKNANYGLLRNTYYEMACLLRREGKHEREFDLLLGVLFLDANGPMNVGGYGVDQGILLSAGVCPFMPSDGDGWVPTTITARVRNLASEMGVDEGAMKARFIERTLFHGSIIPLQPEAAWEKVRPHIFRLQS